MARVPGQVIFLSLMAILGASACSPPPGPPPSAPAARATEPAGGDLIIADTSEPPELNCLRVNDSIAVALCRQIHGTLLAYGRNLEILPRLVADFSISEDETTLTFHLRKDARWHDGTPFTSADVLYTVAHVRAPQTSIQGNLPSLFEPLETVEAPDDHTVVATYGEPYALILKAWTKLFMMPAHLPFEPLGDTPLGRAPIGTGPFKFEVWEPGVRIILTANEAYHDGRPLVDRLIFRVIPNRRSVMVGLKTGELDIAGLDPVEAASLGDEPLPFEVLRFPNSRLEFLMWNTRAEPGLFTDPRVRRALTMAFDREGYVREVLEGGAVQAVSSFLPSMWAHDPEVTPLPHDPAESARLLAEAGWVDRDGDAVLDTPNGPARFGLLYYSGYPNEESIATLFQEAVAPLGIEVELQGLDWPSKKAKVRSGAFFASVYTWTLDSDPDPYDFFHSSQAEAGQNYGGYSNAELDRLAEEGRRTMNVEKRAALYHKIERILSREQPYTFVAHPSAALAVSRRVHGVETGPRGFWGWYPASLRWRVEGR